MTDSLPKPKRRRWVWTTVAIGIGAACLAIVCWSHMRSSRVHAWLVEASQGTPLATAHDSVCMLPVLERIPVVRKLLRHERIQVSAIDEENVGKLLSMPPCPVILKVETLDTISAESFVRLRERFGIDAVR